MAPCPWQTFGGAQTLLTQMFEQHCAENVHAFSTPRQTVPASTGGRQVPARQVVPEQQVPPVAHDPPCGTHEPAVQRSTPPSAGRQRRPSQH